ncbi:nuclease-related domain-containing protein [Bacillus thermotolerans]|uniref:nuclease-related domain-containing protein n=1 Tax=Bacillus thermotolerans TaxID=1221996 RepID=UPI00057EC71F|nr:nuclease-related domain-containing protein [Bacillus thermotolerans]KKB36565.1 hypothetical protein QY97_00964 [Bacillus thermotolerans]
MIVKPRDLPIKLRKLEALDRRLPTFHEERTIIEAELAKVKAGHRGERELDYHLSFLERDQPITLHDLRLPGVSGRFFQMDTLLLYPSMALIVEAKNMSGTLLFDQQFHQLIRTQAGSEDIFADPLLQVRRQAYQLSSWLSRHFRVTLPIIPLIAISSPSAKITTNTNDPSLSDTVLHAAAIPYRVEQLYEEHSSVILSPEQLKAVTRRLLSSHTPYNPDILKLYSIHTDDLEKGVQCPECRCFSMKRLKGGWQCPYCRFRSKHAHLQALTDYALLHAPVINNQQCRAYLQLDSRFTAMRLLTSLNLPHQGDKRGRTYQLDPLLTTPVP